MTSPATLNFPDVVFVEDLDPLGREITSDLQGLQQDIRHIVEQVLASNPDDETKGIGIFNKLSGTAADLAQVPGLIDHELADDERIEGSLTTIEQQATGSWLIASQTQVNGQVITTSFTYSGAGGLQLVA